MPVMMVAFIMRQGIENREGVLKQMLWRLELTGNAERWLVVLLPGFFVAQGAITLVHMSATEDETHYLGMGRYLIQNKKWDLLQPPLSYYLHSIPLFALLMDDQIFRIPDINERGRALMRSQPDDRALLLARVPMRIRFAL
jgi:hypothetical protein